MAEQLNSGRLRHFLSELSALVSRADGDEALILRDGADLLRDLVAVDDWLPAASAQGRPQGYQQHLLYCDPQQRFSVVSFVWGPGQETPVHDHTVWGLVGQLRGSERSIGYELRDGRMTPTDNEVLKTGEVVAVSPRVGDIHKVSNAETDRDSISIHVYGANIGAVRRHVFAPDGTESTFISGYSNATLPNIWGMAG